MICGAMTPMSWMEWYEGLWKPSWTPSPSTIGLIWRILYPIIIVSLGFVIVQAIRRRIPWKATLPFVVNLVHRPVKECAFGPDMLW